MAFKVINNIAGPDSIVLTLLVYGAYPRISELDVLSPTVIQRVITIKKVIDKIRKLKVKCQINNALNMQNGPNINTVHDLLLNL